MRRRTLDETLGLIFLAIAVSACASVPSAPPPVHFEATTVQGRIEELLPQVDREIQKRFDQSGVPGLSVGIVYDGRLIWTHGYGFRDLTRREPVNENTVYRIGSINKVITSLALLQLRDAGKLRLDDPVSLYLPEIQGVVYPTTERPPILIRHLVTHGSGLPHDVPGVPAPVTAAELLSALEGLPLEFTPGTKNQYSNLAMGLAGLVITRAGGKPYREQVQERIFNPLGMTSSAWDEHSVAAGQLATGYEMNGAAPKKLAHHGHDALESAGGLYSSVADLSRFAAFELEAWPPRDAPESPILSRSSLRESQLIAGPQRPVSPNEWAWGVNWGLQSNAPLGYRVQHNGSISGYSSNLLLLPERHLALVYLCSASGSSVNLNSILPDAAEILKAAIPLPAAVLSPPVAEVMATLVAAVNQEAPDLDRMFTREFIDWVAPQTFASMMAKFHQQLGSCHVDRILDGGATHGKAALSCEHGTATFDISVGAKPPNLISSFGWHY